MYKVLTWSNLETIDQIVKCMSGGTPIICSTDTVLGLLAPLTNNSFSFLNETKQRVDKPYIILIESIDKIGVFIKAEEGRRLRPLLERCWPGPVTIIFTAKPSLPSYLKSAIGTISLRVPDHAGLQVVLKQCEGLFSTSANKGGYPLPTMLKELDADLLAKVPYVVVDDQEVWTTPSTIIDCTGPTIKLVREGAYPFEQLKEFISL